MSGWPDPRTMNRQSRWRVWARSGLVVYWVALAVCTHWPGLDWAAGLRSLPWGVELHGVFQLDKAVYALAMAGLTGLLLAARPLGQRGVGAWGAAILAAIIAGLYVAADQWSGLWFGRDAGFAGGRMFPGAGAHLIAGWIGVLGVFLVAVTDRPTVARAGWFVWPMRLAWLVIFPALVLLATLRDVDFEYTRVLHWLGIQGQHLDKAGHFSAALIVTGLMAAAVPLGRRRARAGAVLTVATMATLAPIVEWVQSLIGRDAEAGDVYAHEHGLLVALAVWTAVVMVVRGRGVWIALGRAALGMEPPRKLPWKSSGTLAREVHGESLENAQGDSRQAAPATACEEQPHEKSFVGDAAVVSGLTLLSRVTGLMRDAVLAAALGLTGVSDAFFLGFLVPNLFRRLFGEGALSAAFIPQYAQLHERDVQLARRFASLCVAGLAVLLSTVTLVGELGLWAWQAWAKHAVTPVHGGQVDRGALALHLTMLMLPFMPMICVVALLGGVLQVHRKFGPPAAAPIALNFAMIGFALYGAWTAARGEAGQVHTAVLVAVGVVVAGAVQLIWQFAAAQHHAQLSPVGMFRETWPSARRMLAVMGPMVIGLSVFQFNALLDTLIAMGLSAPTGGGGGRQTFTLLGHTLAYPMRFGDVAALSWAQRLYQFPLGVFGVAIATAIFPALAAAAGKRDTAMPEPAAGRAAGEQGVEPEEREPSPPPPRARAGGLHSNERFATILRQGLGLTVFIGLPASVGLVLVRQPLTRVVYERYAFDTADAMRVATILAGYAVSIWAYSLTQVLTRAFYAVEDATTPLRVSLSMVALNLCLNLILIWPLGAAGLAWSTAISAAGQAALLLWLVRKHVQHPVDRSVLTSWGRTAIASAVMAGVLGPIAWWADFPRVAWGTAATGLAAMVILGAGVVLAVAWIGRSPELGWLRASRKRR